MRLAGRVALVTGGAQGIGSGIARRFAAEGARVAICDVADEIGEALAAELGETARFFHLDVTDPEAWATVVGAVEAAFGPISIVVNNAGIGAQTFVETMAMADFDRVMAVNLYGTIHGMRACIPSLRRSGNGAIVNISSLQGIEADVGLTAYVSSKFAIRGITKSAALELGREGIRANSIHPGMVRTSHHFDTLPDDFFGTIPLKRREAKDRSGYPGDIANLALFLASDDASYITGAEFVIDGAKSVRFAAGALN